MEVISKMDLLALKIVIFPWTIIWAIPPRGARRSKEWFCVHSSRLLEGSEKIATEKIALLQNGAAGRDRSKEWFCRHISLLLKGLRKSHCRTKTRLQKDPSWATSYTAQRCSSGADRSNGSAGTFRVYPLQKNRHSWGLRHHDKNAKNCWS